jgi:sodium/pantothenate symporter
VIRGALKTQSISDFAIGNIQFSPVAVGLSLAASITSAATFVVNPGFIANYGISGVLSFVVFFPMAALISLIVLTKSFRKYGQKTKALTLAQWIGDRYNSKTYSLLMAFMSLLVITFIVLIAVALTKVLSKALNIDEMYVLVGLVVFVFGYIMFGGANSMVYTNTIQAGVMIVVAVILLTSGYEHFKDGIDGFIEKLRNIDPVLAETTNPGSLLFRDYYEIIFAQIIVGIAVVVQPHIITKSLLLKSDKQVNKFLTVAVIAEVLFFAVAFTGLYARIEFPDLTFMGETLKNDGIIPAYVVSAFSQGWVSVSIGLIVILGLISAGLSTLEGLIQSVSTTITSDIVKPLSRKKLSEKQLMSINKLAIVGLAAVTIIVSWDQIVSPKLSVGILAQNGVYAYFSAAFIPVLFGIFIKKVDFRAPLAATITSIVVHFSVYYLLPAMVSEYNLNFGFFTKYLTGVVRNPAIAASSAIIISTLVGVTVHQITKKKFQEN